MVEIGELLGGIIVVLLGWLTGRYELQVRKDERNIKRMREARARRKDPENDGGK